MGKKTKFYKDKYCIGVYEKTEDETLIGLFDTPQELANYLNTTLNVARSILSHTLNGTQKSIVVSNKLATLALIDMTEED